MKSCCTSHWPRYTHRRPGGALIVLLVLITISLGLVGVWARSSLQESRRMTEKLWRIQATRLAEAGVRRAAARRASDEQFKEETWAIPVEQLGGKHAAAVRIRVTADAEAGTIQYQATAEYPVGSTRRARVTERITVPDSMAQDKTEGSS